MRIHHLSCGTMCPFGGRLLSGEGSLFATAKLVCHCLLIETPGGLVLVDTGFGEADVADPRRRLGRQMLLATRPRLDTRETALRQIEALSLQPRDVRHVLMTHLDVDHTGGLADFPDATVHVLGDEHAAAMSPRHVTEHTRYRPIHWAHAPRWNLLAPTGSRFHGFDCVRDIPGLPPEILLVPLPGHTRGHTAVAVNTSRGWLLHCGDAYFHHDEIDLEHPSCPILLRAFQRLNAVNARQRLANLERVRELLREPGGAIRAFSAHDPVELERLQTEAPRTLGAATNGAARHAEA